MSQTGGNLPESRRWRAPVRVGIVIPCYRVRGYIEEVVRSAIAFGDRVYVVDDKCPEGSGRFVESLGLSQVVVVYHERNYGVGGATITGIRRALEDGMDVIVKVDGDGQMDPRRIPSLVAPILRGQADYTKGNRFFYPEDLREMPWVRLLGNAALSFLSKLSTGYWNLFDPTNGFVAIHATVARRIPWEKVHRRFFFESDVLFRLYLLRAKVVDVPMPARYRGEPSSLSVGWAIPQFLFNHARNFVKRIFYCYILRDFSLASIELFTGMFLLVLGVVAAAWEWWQSYVTGIPRTPGTIMLVALPILLGLQLLLGFLAFDIRAVPQEAVHPLFQAGPSEGFDGERLSPC